MSVPPAARRWNQSGKTHTLQAIAILTDLGGLMAELPETLVLGIGQTWTSPLEASGGGYRWCVDVEGDDGVVQAATDYVDGDVVEGAWRGEIVTVTGAGPGTVDVHIACRRPWETAGGEDAGQIMKVTVRPT